MPNSGGMGAVSSNGTASTSERTIHILKFISAAGMPLTIRDISGALGIERNAVRRSIQALCNEGLLFARGPREGYSISRSVLSLVNQFDLYSVEKRIIVAAMEKIKSEVPYAVCFEVTEGKDLVVDHVVKSPSDPFASMIHTGMKVPIHCTSIGKMVLASRFAEFGPVFSGALCTPSEFTISDPVKVFEIGSAHYERGYAVACGEYAPELACAGAPVKRGDGRVIGGISVAGSYDEFKSSYGDEIGANIGEKCRCINAELAAL